MEFSLESAYPVILTVIAVAVLVAGLGSAARVGGRGTLLDAAILATGTALACWAVAVARWPGGPVDTAAVLRTAAAASAGGLLMPAVLARRPGRPLPVTPLPATLLPATPPPVTLLPVTVFRAVLLPVALLGHLIAQASALGGVVPAPAVAVRCIGGYAP